MGISQGHLPFRYLGALIFKRAPKGEYFNKFADKIRSKLATWKGMLLLMAESVELVKSVIQRMMVDTIMIFTWPRQLMQMWINNFLWTRDSRKRGIVMVNWK